ncbi:MAG TPA: DUF423 domain-containing protein [Hyphomicrobium sp.]|nr:DUF423 domain-containing protein [Hyphomicrobium sp.]
MAHTKGALALLAGAGLAGAAGVALAAAAAHKIESPALATAASMLMIHAAAVVGIAVLATIFPHRGFVPSGASMLAGVCLFAGAVTFHAVTGEHIFPFAAPTGGSLTIASWLALAGCAAAAIWRQPR